MAALGLAILVLAGCERAKSANPLSPSIAGPIAGVEIVPPMPVTPPPASQVPVHQQPITLTIENAATNGVRPVSYVFEIGADEGFATKLFSQTGVEAGEGRTSLKLPQTLEPERRYYWRARADDGANASDYSPTASFHVYTPVVIQPPALREPADGAIVSTRKPTFVVANAERTGPAGTIQYLFEVAADAAMANKVVSAMVDEGSGQTSFTPSGTFAYETIYYWRVKAVDPGHESGYSNIRSFSTPAAPIVVPTLPTGPGPGPVAGDAINMHAATIHNSPHDVAHWPVTSAITEVDIRTNGVHVEFDKNYGPDRWPDVYPPGWDEPLQFTLGMCLNISGSWHCSAPIQFWNGLDRSGGPPSRYIEEWFYDSYRWGPMSSHRLSLGEMIGFFVCGGNCRNNTSGSNSTVKERTNVVLVPYPGDAGGNFRF